MDLSLRWSRQNSTWTNHAYKTNKNKNTIYLRNYIITSVKLTNSTQKRRRRRRSIEPRNNSSSSLIFSIKNGQECFTVMWWLHGRSWGGLLLFLSILNCFLNLGLMKNCGFFLFFVGYGSISSFAGLWDCCWSMLLALARKLGIFAALQFMILLVIRCSLPHYIHLIIILDSFFFLWLFLKKLINLLIYLSSVIEALVLALFFQ